MATVFLNGRFLAQDDARISAFDAGLQHGVGLFETMLGGRHGGTPPLPARRHEGEEPAAWVFRLQEHIERLISSARGLGLSDQLHAGPLAQAVLRTVAESDLTRARIRLTITGGDLNLLGRRHEGTPPLPARRHEGKAGVQPTILIVAQPATEYPPDMFARGITAAIADLRINPLDPFAGHKTINYWPRLRELQAAAARHAGEALIFQATNHLAGGCVSNAFIVKEGRILTPIARGEEGGGAKQRNSETARQGGPTPAHGVAVPSPVLPGITRTWLIQWAAEQGIEVARRMITIDDILGADEVFLTNSSWGVLPVVRVEKEAIGRRGGGGVGPITTWARGAWLAATEP